MSLTRRINRLVQKLHRAFDKDPEARLAFRMRALDGILSWKVAGGRFTVTRNGGVTPVIDLALEGRSIAELAAAVAGLAGVRVELGRTRGYYETRAVPIEAATLLDAATVERTGALPAGWTFTRPGRAHSFDAAGVLRRAEAGQPRIQWTNGIPGILTEPASRNVNRNPWFLFGTPGPGGALPRFMATAGGAGLAVVLQNVFTDDKGMAWAELRVSGTATDPELDIFFDTAPARTSTGQRWTASLYLWHTGGSLAGLTIGNGILLTGTGSYAENGSILSTVTPTATPARWARSTTATATAAGAQHYLAIKMAPGTQVEASIRVAIPQLEPGDLASTPMLPGFGNVEVTERAQEDLYLLTADLPGWNTAPEVSLAVDFLHANHPHDRDLARAVLGVAGRPEGELLLGVYGNRATVQLGQAIVQGPTVTPTGPQGFGARSMVPTRLRGGTVLASFNGRAPVSPTPSPTLSYVLRADGVPYLNSLGQPYLTRDSLGDDYLAPGELPQPNTPALYAGHAGGAITRAMAMTRSLSNAQIQELAAAWRWPTEPGQSYVEPEPDFTEMAEQQRILARPATLLLDGTGQAELTGRDELQTPTAILWGFLAAYAAELNVAQANIDRAPAAMATSTSEGEWLDELGSLYGYRRKLGEGERAYGERIIREVLRPRGNNVAIEIAIEEATGAEATVTNVVEYGTAVPDHSGTYRHDGRWLHNATAKPLYGLFDVEAAFDLLGSDTPTAYQATVRELVERMRDAGTFLRAIAIRGGNIDDTGLLAADQTAPLAMDATATLDDTAPDATDMEPAMEGDIDLDETGAIADDTEDTLLLSWFTLYDGKRLHDGSFLHASGTELATTMAS